MEILIILLCMACVFAWFGVGAIIIDVILPKYPKIEKIMDRMFKE